MNKAPSVQTTATCQVRTGAQISLRLPWEAFCIVEERKNSGETARKGRWEALPRTAQRQTKENTVGSER